MPPDVPIVVAFLYIFLTMNFYGWGIWHDQRFIFFTLSIGALYTMTGLFWQKHDSKQAVLVRASLLFSFIAVAVVAASINFVGLRAKTAPEGFMSDSGVMVDVAGRFVLAGKNPYSESYRDTELARVPYKDETGNTLNPALNHNAYPPMLLIISALSQRITAPLFHIVDIRLTYIAFYLLLLFTGWKILRMGSAYILFLALIGLNPMFVSLMVQGANDIVVITMFVGAMWMLQRRTYLLAGLLFGLSLATKQVAWISIPFVAYYTWRQAKRADLVRFFGFAGIVCALIYGPFFFWNAQALLDSLIFYMSGSLATSYPINNFGFGMLLVAVRQVPSVYSYYPFWVWQLIGFALVVAVWIKKQGKNPTMQHVLVGFTVGLSVVWFFNRFMNYSYLATLQILSALAYLWPANEKSAGRK